ncbi:hypothetical protein QTJ16_000086 [Diplocarpon rosae]|uniref:Uncharacterized protein n=1 Tax=Diplocarpon rosae TaxID=946125 RepID=A0AAD9WH63_9HELO|nr:hypothetical protein QTJ16_000086 [Diplocarpon rosae]PBP17221.1 cell wall glycosyl hydrolase YteR [Diplocarpon rosae]
MKTSFVSFFSLAGMVSAASCAWNSTNSTHSTNSTKTPLPAGKLSVLSADTFLLRKYAQALNAKGEPFLTYINGVGWKALEMVYNVTGDQKYLDHITKGVDNIVTDDGALRDYNLTYYTVDDIRIGETLLYLFKETGALKYKGAADILRRQLQTNPRNSHGGFWHRSIYPNQMWLDGLYMIAPFYAHYSAYYDQSNTTAFDDIVKQFELTHINCVNNNPGQTGILKHGYDESRTASWADDATGASPESWNRALGWYVMAIVDVLEYLPASHPGVAKLLAILEENIAGIKKNVDPDSKLWWLVMTQPGKEKNYIESSAGAMFVYAILKGIRLGYLDSTAYLETATTAYHSLVEKFVFLNQTDGGLNWEGTVSVGSLKDKGDYDYYVSVPLETDDLKGYGPFIMASVEFEKLGN